MKNGIKKLKELVKKIDITDVLLFIGVVYINKAMYSISYPLGDMFAGIVLVALALLIHKTKDKKKNE